jgi:hypothetical protein
MNEFLIYQSFYEAADAEELAAFLKENGIPVVLGESRAYLDRTFAGVSSEQPFHVKIPGAAFTKANQLLEEKIAGQTDEIDKEHYLFSFSSTELQDLVNKPEEWSKQGLALARVLLKEKGVIITDQQLEKIKTESYQRQAKPEKWDLFMLILAYAATLLFAYPGIFLGLLYINTRKVLPDGKRVYAFDNTGRTHGFIMLVTGSLLITLGLFNILNLNFFEFFWFLF